MLSANIFFAVSGFCFVYQALDFTVFFFFYPGAIDILPASPGMKP